jgi:hypothetical protein
MTNRIFMGQLNGTMGLYISQAGQDVKTCDPSYMLFTSSGGRQSQVLATGQIVFAANTTGTQNVPITNNTSSVPLGVFYETLQVPGGTGVSASYQWTTYTLTTNNLAVTRTVSINASLTVTYVIFTDNSNG